MKKLLIVFALCGAFLSSCEIDELKTNNSISSNDRVLADYFLYENNNLKSSTSINKFSEYLLNFNPLSIDVKTGLVKQSININIKTGNLYINGEKISFDKHIYTLSLVNESYILGSNLSKFYISKNIKNNEYYFHELNHKVSFNDIKKGNYKVDTQTEIELAMQIAILNEFVDISDKEREYAPPRYEGSGIGIHLNLADSKYFCERDHNQILADNPTWCSPGISYSCVWRELICTCVSNFYSGDDCK